MVDDAIDGLKIRTFGPKSGFAGPAAIAEKAEGTTSAAANQPGLPNIGAHRFRRQRSREPLAVILHVEGLGEVRGAGCDQHDLAVGGEKGDCCKLLLLARTHAHGSWWHKPGEVCDRVVPHIARNTIAVQS